MKRIIGVILVAMLIISLSSCEEEQREMNHKDGVYYEIFVRSFADSDGDGIGDIQGIIDKLDYLNDGDDSTTDDLGVEGIWLMPIMPSPSYHKYDVQDYYDVDEDYGSIKDFKRLVKECHKRDISVVIDLVINHTSVEHEWFVSALEEEEKYKDYYNWATNSTGEIDINATVWGHDVWNNDGTDEYYYAIFWDQMPDLNYENEAVREEIKKVAKFWLDAGVDGFRLDAAKHLYGEYEYEEAFNLTDKNVEWWDEFRTYVKSVNKDAILVAEVWDSAEVVKEYTGVFDLMFNFDAAEEISHIMVSGNNDNDFATNLENYYKDLAQTSEIYVDAPFLSNHDQDRIINTLSTDVTANRQAASIYLTLPGIPFVYYGEELGMRGTKPDEYIRQPFLWGEEDGYETSWINKRYNKTVPVVSEQLEDEESLLNFYKKMIQLRNENEALNKGTFEALSTVEGNENLLAYIRSSENQKVLVLHNISYNDENYAIDSLNILPKEVLFSFNGASFENNTIELPSRSTLIVEIN